MANSPFYQPNSEHRIPLERTFFAKICTLDMGPQPFRSSPLRVGGSLKNGCQDPRMAVKKRKLLCIPQGEEFVVLSQKGTERRMMRGTEKKRGAGTIGRS